MGHRAELIFGLRFARLPPFCSYSVKRKA